MGSLPPVESSPPARRHEGAWDGCCRAFSKGFLPCALTSPRTVERSAVRIALPRSVGTATPTYASSTAIANKLKLQRRCHRRDDEIGLQNQNQIYVAIRKIRPHLCNLLSLERNGIITDRYLQLCTPRVVRSLAS